MGNEISTVGGAVATTGTAIAAGVTFGQVKSLNNAVEACAKYTGESFMKTSVRHIGETAGKGVATAATAVAAGVTLGQVESLNNAVVVCAKSTAESSKKAAEATANIANDVLDGTPGVGHVKGAIHYACGDNEGGDKAMKSASRTVGVVAGGAGGFMVGGPAGAVLGGVAGGAAMDGIISGADSAVHGEKRLYGQIAAWDAVAHGETDHEIIDGVVGGLFTPAFDALGGHAAGKGVAARANKPPQAGKPNPPRPPKPNQGLKTAPKGPNAPGSKGVAVSEKNPPVSGQPKASTASTKASTAKSVEIELPTIEQKPPVSGQPKASTASTRASTAKPTDIPAIEKNPPVSGQSRPSTASTKASTAKPTDVTAIEQKPAASGQSRASTASTRDSTSKTSVSPEQNLDGFADDKGPFPKNPNNALNAFMKEELTPQPNQPRLQTQPEAHAQLQQPTVVVAAAGAANSSLHAKAEADEKPGEEGGGGEQGRGGEGQGGQEGQQGAQAEAEEKPGGEGEGGEQGGGEEGQGGQDGQGGNGGQEAESGAEAEEKPGGEEGGGGQQGGEGGGQGGQDGSGRPPDRPGGPGGPGAAGGGMTHPHGFWEHFGMTEAEFYATFQDQGNGTFIAPNGFDFVHAVNTTGDQPTTIATVTGTQQTVQGSAGDLWQRCTGQRITQSTCAVHNCTNRHFTGGPQSADVTAHVYLTSQTSEHPIEYMVLMPTCSGCNNHVTCSRTNTNYPPQDQTANVLQARPGTRVIFVRIDRNTRDRKGEKNRGKGQGGTFGGHFRRDGGNGDGAGPKGGKGGKGCGKGESNDRHAPY